MILDTPSNAHALIISTSITDLSSGDIPCRIVIYTVQKHTATAINPPMILLELGLPHSENAALRNRIRLSLPFPSLELGYEFDLDSLRNLAMKVTLYLSTRY